MLKVKEMIVDSCLYSATFLLIHYSIPFMKETGVVIQEGDKMLRFLHAHKGDAAVLIYTKGSSVKEVKT